MTASVEGSGSAGAAVVVFDVAALVGAFDDDFAVAADGAWLVCAGAGAARVVAPGLSSASEAAISAVTVCRFSG